MSGPGEASIDTVLREMQEELGVDLTKTSTTSTTTAAAAAPEFSSKPLSATGSVLRESYNDLNNIKAARKNKSRNNKESIIEDKSITYFK